MQSAARFLVGCHDFVAFQTLGSPRQSTVRTIRELSVEAHNALDGFDLMVEIQADGFLYNMVRNIVGSLVDIGSGRFGPRWIEDTLNSKERNRAGQTAPPHGLCLMQVEYPAACFLET